MGKKIDNNFEKIKSNKSKKLPKSKEKRKRSYDNARDIKYNYSKYEYKDE